MHSPFVQHTKGVENDQQQFENGFESREEGGVQESAPHEGAKW